MAERTLLDVTGGPLEVRISHGDPSLPSLVWLHEGLGSIDLWRGVPDEVGDLLDGATTVVYSRHGHGRSGAARLPRPVDYMHHEADVVLPELLEVLEIERPVLVGHSDGASIALLFAGAGWSTTGLVCLAPHVFVEPESVAGVEAAREAFAETDLEAKMGRYHDDASATFFGWNDIWRSAEFRTWNIEDRLSGVEAPVLLIQGSSDQYGTVAQLDAIERGVSGPCRQVLLDGIGHAPHLDARRRTVDEVAAFVRDVSGNGD